MLAEDKTLKKLLNSTIEQLYHSNQILQSHATEQDQFSFRICIQQKVQIHMHAIKL